MAYRVEQDRLRAMLPEGFTSLRPVLRINAARIPCQQFLGSYRVCFEREEQDSKR